MKQTILIPAPKLFFSYQDEKNFFGWLEGIPAVQSCLGSAAGLSIEIESPIDNDSLADLIALLKRYGLNMHSLASLLNESNKSWFKNDIKYWYNDVFM